MKTGILVCLSAVAVALLPNVGLAEANLSWELGLSGMYTSNLLSDASDLEDSYSTTQATAYWYPLASLRLKASGEYTYYSETFGLSNFSGAGGFMWIPTDEAGSVSLYVEGSLDTRMYRTRFEEFDNHNAILKSGVAYEVSPRFRVRGGLIGRMTSYPHPDIATDPDYNQAEVFAGLNLGLPLNNSLDCEAGYGITGYAFINSAIDSVYPPLPGMDPDAKEPPTKFLRDGDFRSFYISPRLSRSIGTKTGLSLTYTYREFARTEDAVVLGYTTSFLSPWNSFFEGSSVTFQVKTYVIPHFIISTGAGYWDKTFLRTSELESKYVPTYPGHFMEVFYFIDPKDAKAREDEMSRYFISFQRPFLFGATVVEPGLSIDYSDNRSTNEDYDYTSTSVNFTLTARP